MDVKFTAGPSGLVRIWTPPKPRNSGGVLVLDENENHSHSSGSPGALEPVGDMSGGSTLDYRSESETGPIRQNRITKFGTYARRKLREAGAAIEQAAGSIEDCLFLTGTLPSVEPIAWAVLAEYSGWLVHRLKAWVNKYAPGKLDFYVWEWQGRGALHLHYCCLISDPKSKEAVLKGFQARWVGWLQRIQDLSGVFMFRGAEGQDHSQNPENVQALAVPVEKSVGAYLSKYLGKGTGNPPSSHGDYFYPSRWWGVSRPLQGVVRAMTVEGEFNAKGQRPSQIYEELISSGARVAVAVFEWKNKVGSGDNAAVIFATQSEALDWINNPGGGIVAKKNNVTARQAALIALNEAEKWLEHTEVMISGNPTGDDERALRLIVEGLDYTSTIMDANVEPPMAAVSTVLFETMMLIGRIRNILPCRTDELTVRNLKLKIQAALKIIRPVVYMELFALRETVTPINAIVRK